MVVVVVGLARCPDKKRRTAGSIAGKHSIGNSQAYPQARLALGSTRKELVVVDLPKEQSLDLSLHQSLSD